MSAPDLTLWQAAADLTLEVRAIADGSGQDPATPVARALCAGMESRIACALARWAWREGDRETELVQDCGHPLEAVRWSRIDGPVCAVCVACADGGAA